MTGFYTPFDYRSYANFPLQVGYSGTLLNTTVNEPQKPVTPDITDIAILNYICDQHSWDIVNPAKIDNFLDKNPNVFNEVRTALNVLPQYIRQSFSFKLELKSDPEIDNFQTLYLYITGSFSPQEAVTLLEVIDNSWLNKNVSNVSKFNIDVEFT